jgi:dynein heavy chain
MEMFSGLGDVKIEGIDIITVKFKTICDAAKKKNYDILDHRKAEVLWLDYCKDIKCKLFHT